MLVDGRPRLVVGSAGSSRLRGAVMQIVVNVLGHDLDVANAIAAPRVHLEGDVLHLEPPLEPGDVPYEVARWNERNLFFGGVSAVEQLPDGTLGAAGDPRRGGAGLVVLDSNPPNRDWAGRPRAPILRACRTTSTPRRVRTRPLSSARSALARCSSSSRSRGSALLPLVLARAFDVSFAVSAPIVVLLAVIYWAAESDSVLMERGLKGRNGEAVVGEALEGLRWERYIVLHDVPFAGEGNIDHLVSGPNGVYLVETKFGSYLPVHLKKAKRQAAKLGDELGVLGDAGALRRLQRGRPVPARRRAGGRLRRAARVDSGAEQPARRVRAPRALLGGALTVRLRHAAILFVAGGCARAALIVRTGEVQLVTVALIVALAAALLRAGPQRV